MMLGAIVTRLNDIPGLITQVEVRLQVEEVLALESTGPCIWVVETRGAGERNNVLGAVSQQRNALFGVLTLVSGVAGASESELQIASQALRDSVFARLLGFRPSTQYIPIEYVRDGLVQSADGDVYWLDEFRTSHQICSN